MLDDASGVFKSTLFHNEEGKDTTHPPKHAQPDFRIERPAYVFKDDDWVTDRKHSVICSHDTSINIYPFSSFKLLFVKSKSATADHP